MVKSYPCSIYGCTLCTVHLRNMPIQEKIYSCSSVKLKVKYVVIRLAKSKHSMQCAPEKTNNMVRVEGEIEISLSDVIFIS